MLATPEGRRLFWAVSAEETRGEITFEFVSGQRLSSRVLEAVAPRRYALTYFAGSHVTFELLPDGGGGTDLTLTEWNVLDDALAENIAAWVSVLLHLKAAADFGVDLRNHDPKRGWHHGYVDV